MLKRQITPAMCAEVVKHLTRSKRWSVARIAKAIQVSPDFVRRVASARQSFQYPELEALALAAGSTPHLLVFRSMRRERLSEDLKDLYDITRDVVASGERFKRAMARQNTSKRRNPTRAA
jgi:hypothetical protein